MIANKSNIFYIVDDHSPSYLFNMSKFKTILISSPKKENTKSFTKENCKKLYLPMWTKEELEKCIDCLQLDISKEIVDELTEICGCVPRFVIQNFSKENVLEEINEALSNSTIESLLNFNGNCSSNDDISHRILHTIVDDNFNKLRFDFASEFIKNMIIKRFENDLI